MFRARRDRPQDERPYTTPGIGVAPAPSTSTAATPSHACDERRVVVPQVHGGLEVVVVVERAKVGVRTRTTRTSPAPRPASRTTPRRGPARSRRCPARVARTRCRRDDDPVGDPAIVRGRRGTGPARCPVGSSAAHGGRDGRRACRSRRRTARGRRAPPRQPPATAPPAPAAFRDPSGDSPPRQAAGSRRRRRRT